MSVSTYNNSVGASGPVDVGLVETCAGGSATLPCLSLNMGGAAVEGVSLKRWRGQAPVEVVYHSKFHDGSSTQFSPERVHLSSVPSPGGLTYNLSLQRLQPDDSGLYSCQLLLRGQPDSTAGLGLGTQVFFLSVQGELHWVLDGQVSNLHFFLKKRLTRKYWLYSTLLPTQYMKKTIVYYSNDIDCVAHND